MSDLLPTSYYDGRAQTVDLTDITSSDNNAEIVRMLRDNDPKLRSLWIYEADFENSEFDDFVVQEGNDLGWLGYFLGRNTMLRNLGIEYMPAYGEQITALFRGIEQNRSIQRLYIVRDPLGESMLSSLSAMLRSESCCLTKIKLGNTRVSDDVAVALADALKGNKSLKHLLFDSRHLTSVGVLAFSKLLCDTSSVSDTYNSNHTLQKMWWNDPDNVKQLLALNKQTDKHVAICKILKHHPDFDIRPFLGNEWKLLPLLMSWFERVREMSVESEEEIEKRQLSAMFKFVRSMPDQAIDSYRSYSVGKELQGPKVERHTYCHYSSHKERKFGLLVRDFTVICILVLLCLLNLVLPTWSGFVASLFTHCLLVNLLLKE